MFWRYENASSVAIYIDFSMPYGLQNMWTNAILHGFSWTLFQMGFNYQNRSPMRCDPTPFSVPPTFYRNYNNYNTRQYKNVVKV